MTNQVRRYNRRLPSLKKHGLSAVLLLLIIILSIYIWMQWAAKNPGQARGNAIPLPAPTAQSNIVTPTPLPDLLEADNIPLDSNPTQIQTTRTLDLLGAPDGQGNTAPIRTNTINGENGSKTILIDGQPIITSRSTSGPQTGMRPAPLLRAPIQGLTRLSPFGPVPVIAKDGRTIRSVYARPFTPAPNTRYIVVTVGGLGIDAGLTRRAITQLPPNVTLSFAAEAPNLQKWINQAREYGHEVMLELPMQGEKALAPNDPGANYQLTVDSPPSANIRNLDYLLSRAEGYFALTNYDGAKLVTDSTAMGPITAHMQAAGTAFVFDGSAPDAGLKSAAKSSGLPIVSARLLLDGTANDAVSVAAQMRALQGLGGAPIGMGFSYAGTIDGIQNWIANKPSGIDLAPVSYALTLAR